MLLHCEGFIDLALEDDALAIRSGSKDADSVASGAESVLLDFITSYGYKQLHPKPSQQHTTVTSRRVQ